MVGFNKNEDDIQNRIQREAANRLCSSGRSGGGIIVWLPPKQQQQQQQVPLQPLQALPTTLQQKATPPLLPVKQQQQSPKGAKWLYIWRWASLGVHVLILILCICLWAVNLSSPSGKWRSLPRRWSVSNLQYQTCQRDSSFSRPISIISSISGPKTVVLGDTLALSGGVVWKRQTASTLAADCIPISGNSSTLFVYDYSTRGIPR